MRPITRLLPALVFATLGACGGEKKAGDTGEVPAAPAVAASAPTVAATGTVIEIIATTDDKGSYFKPKVIAAKAGDVLRVKLVTGVHNVNFLADSNKGRSGLPAPSLMLQLPGQTVEIPLTFGTGTFYFQCDPHAALGMIAHLTVK